MGCLRLHSVRASSSLGTCLSIDRISQKYCIVSRLPRLSCSYPDDPARSVLIPVSIRRSCESTHFDRVAGRRSRYSPHWFGRRRAPARKSAGCPTSAGSFSSPRTRCWLPDHRTVNVCVSVARSKLVGKPRADCGITRSLGAAVARGGIAERTHQGMRSAD